MNGKSGWQGGKGIQEDAMALLRLRRRAGDEIAKQVRPKYNLGTRMSGKFSVGGAGKGFKRCLASSDPFPSRQNLNSEFIL
jgi:hypothetical protein